MNKYSVKRRDENVLSKPLNSSEENIHIFVAGDIYEQPAVAALAMRHASEYSAVGRRDALNCKIRPAGIKANVTGGLFV